ncbi:MAG: hypothetical protein K2L56_00590 [Prevotella sp.]|nr:hypothetical protein [Prevotella sp.]
MKIKPILRTLEVVANAVIVGTAAKSIYNKFSSSDDDDEEDDEIKEDED